MTLDFTCTLEDYVEALRVHRSLARGQRVGLGERLLFLWIVLLILSLLAAMAVVEGVYRGTTGAPRVAEEVTPTDWFIAILVPVLLWTVCFGLLWFAFSAAIGPTERRPFRNALLLMLAALLVVNVVNVALHGVPPRDAQRPVAAPADEPSLLSTLSPLLVMAVAIWYVLFRYLRGAARRNWEAQPQLHRPQTLELTTRGLRITVGGDRATHDYAWPTFSKYREGPNVFLLYISDLAFHMVPKRAIADPSHVDAFRAAVGQHVPCVDPGPTGFPIQQSPPTKPVPAVPIRS